MWAPTATQGFLKKILFRGTGVTHQRDQRKPGYCDTKCCAGSELYHQGRQNLREVVMGRATTAVSRSLQGNSTAATAQGVPTRRRDEPGSQPEKKREQVKRSWIIREKGQDFPAHGPVCVCVVVREGKGREGHSRKDAHQHQDQHRTGIRYLRVCLCWARNRSKHPSKGGFEQHTIGAKR